MSQPDTRALFAKADANNDGFITKAEFRAAVASLPTEIAPAAVDAFLSQVDIDGEDKLSFEELNHFVSFYTSKLTEFGFLVGMTAQAIGVAKKIDRMIDVKDLNQGDPSRASILLRDQNSNGIGDAQSSVELHVGDLESNTHIAKILNHKFDAQATLGFKFEVKNRQMIKDNFKQYIDALKEFLADLGPEANQVLEAVNIQLFEVEDGVFLTVDPASHPFINSFVEILRSNFEHLQSLKASLSALIGVGTNLGNKSLTYEQLIDSNFYFELNGRAIRLANIAQTPSIKKQLQTLSGNKNGKGTLLAALCVLSFRNVNMELNLNSDDRRQFIAQSDIKDLNSPVWEAQFNAGEKMLTESGLGDFLDSLDFVKQAVNDLQQAECTSVSVFAKVHDVYAVVKVKADVYPALNQLFKLQG